MKKLLQLLLPFILPVGCFAQGLLLNGSFEDENICTEYNIACSPEAWISSFTTFSDYYKDANRAFDGRCCMGILVGHAYKPYHRTFIRSRLLCGLRAGAQYRLEFYIKSRHPVLDSMGIYFGPIDPLLERKPIHLLSPSLRLIDQGNQFKKDSSWQKATLVYTANGNEGYITIANFSINDISGPTGIEKENNFYVYIDKITLVPVNPNEMLCDDWEQTREDIYEENERHEFLQRVIRHRQSSPRPVQKPTPTTVFVSDTLMLPDLLFATGKKDLKPSSQGIIDSFCASMNGKTIDSLVISGHTDNVGTDESNEQLSMDRAISVDSYIARCAAFFRVPVIRKGEGSKKPIADNDTPEGRQQNRRVELMVYFRE